MAQSLEDMGIAGHSFLQEALTNTTDPLGAIEEFQQENSILLPSLQPALPLLDLHGLKRLDFHKSVFEELREKLQSRIEEISKSGDEDAHEKLEAILDKSFPLIKIKSLQPVTMCLFKHLPEVPEKYLKALIKDKELYKSSPIEVKRQIWQNNQAMFGDEVLPLLNQYIKDKDTIIFSTEGGMNNFFSSLPKQRRQGTVVKQLANMIGKNVRLYDMVLQFLRTLFMKTKNVHYCSLRAEILMALHDLEISDICSVDPCYKFTWCLDACIREKYVDVKRARELQGFLDSVRRGHEQVLGDLSMILFDPFAVNTMLWSIMKVLQDLTTHETLPRDSAELVLLIRMLALGQSAWEIINKQVFKEPRIDLDVVTRFMPALLSIGVCNTISNIVKKTDDFKKSGMQHNEQQQDSSTSETEDKKNFDDSTSVQVLITFLQQEPLSCQICMWYILYLVKYRRKTLLLKILSILGKHHKESSTDPIFLHALVAQLSVAPGPVALEDILSDEEFCQTLFKFMLPGRQHKEVSQKQTLRLLLSTYHRIPASRSKPLIAKLESKGKKHSEVVADLLSKVNKKISDLESVAAEKKALPKEDPSLLGVPTPAPI
ncbi:negative elongation factor B-like [Styela clava]